jgi:hypothetical protein
MNILSKIISGAVIASVMGLGAANAQTQQPAASSSAPAVTQSAPTGTGITAPAAKAKAHHHKMSHATTGKQHKVSAHRSAPKTEKHAKVGVTSSAKVDKKS